MIKTTLETREKVKVEHAQGGEGFIIKDNLISGAQLGDTCKMFSTVTLKPGCEVGYHQHNGDCEAYFVISGTAHYEEDGQSVELTAGDLTFCEDGHFHGIKNTGDEDFVMVALILKR